MLDEEHYATISAPDGLPVLYNALHFIQDPEELAIRNNARAAFTLRRFVRLVASDAFSGVSVRMHRLPCKPENPGDSKIGYRKKRC